MKCSKDRNNYYVLHKRHTLKQPFFLAPQHSLYIQGISASIPCIPFLFPRSGYPSQLRRGEGRGCRGPTLRPKGHCGFKCAPCVARAAIALMQSDRDRCDISVPTHFHTTSHRLGVTHIPLLWSCPPAAGQHNDARMNLAIALTAARYGAAIANYTEVVHLLERADPQTGKGRVCGAHCRDVITGKSNKSRFLPSCLTLFPLSLALTTGFLPAPLTQC